MKERKIYVTDNSFNTSPSKKGYPSPLNKGYPILQKGKDSNINIRIDRLFSYYINNEGKILELFNSKDELYDFYYWIDKLEFNYTKDSLTIVSDANIIKIKTILYAIKDICQSNRKSCLNRITREEFINIYDKCKEIEIKSKDTENEINNFYEYYHASILKKYAS